MNLLALDPSSRCLGWAVLTGLDVADLLAGGLVKPSTARAAIAHLPAWEQQHLAQPELRALRRIVSMLPDIHELVEEHAPDRIVIEWPSGKTGTGAKRGAKGALATYGAAAGVVYAYAAQLLPGRVAAVTERQWTRGRGSKPKRRQVVASVYRSYDATLDPGGDLADAIGLARWCLEDPQRCGLDVARNEVKHA